MRERAAGAKVARLATVHHGRHHFAGLVPGVERDGCGTISTVRLSALTGAGTADLRAALAERFPFQRTAEELPVAASEP